MTQHPRCLLLSPVLALAWAVTAPPLPAQGPPTGPRSTLAVGLGLGSSAMSAGGTHSEASGLLALLRFQRRALALELEFHPYAVPNPVGDERFRALYALAGVRLPLGANLYLLPSVGLQLRFWSGSQRVTASDRGLALGAALGASFPLDAKTTLNPELAYRAASIEFKGSVSTHALTARLVVARHL